MYSLVGEHVFPFLRTLGGDDSTYAHHMKDARFAFAPREDLHARVVDCSAEGFAMAVDVSCHSTT